LGSFSRNFFWPKSFADRKFCPENAFGRQNSPHILRFGKMGVQCQRGAISRKVIIWFLMPSVFALLFVGWREAMRYKYERVRADWLVATLPQIAGLSLTNPNPFVGVHGQHFHNGNFPLPQRAATMAR
jgi:hypothetical protein